MLFFRDRFPFAKRDLLLAFFSVGFLVGSLSAGEVSTSDLRKEVEAACDENDISGGVMVHFPCRDGEQTAALQMGEKFLVQGLAADDQRLKTCRKAIQALGRYGEISVHPFDGVHLPYVDHLVNVVVTEDPGRVPMEEIMRILAPGGVACVFRDGTWQRTVKPVPETIDDWTHWMHSADGNPVANDRLVAPPRHVQWIADPKWQRHHEMSPSINAMVSSGGRVFAIINEAPIGVDGLPDRWVLIARDAFNGTLLWKRPISEYGWKYWGDHSYGHGRWNHPTHIARRLVAEDDRRVFVTLGFNAPVTALDAATGETIQTYPGTEFTDEILLEQGRLILAKNCEKQHPGKIAEKPPSEKAVMAIDPDSAEVLWETHGFGGAASKADAIERVTHLMMVAGGERVFLIEENALVALDLHTGDRVWERKRPERPHPVAYGSYYFTNLNSMIYQDGRLFFTEPDPTIKKMPWDVASKARLFAFSAEDGEELWKRPCGIWGHYSQPDLFHIDGRLWVFDDASFALLGLDPASGEEDRRIPVDEAFVEGHHHRCYRNKATPQYLITSRRGIEFIDLESGENLIHHWVRGTCRYGVMPANGLLYAPPHPCVCYITSKLNGFWSLSGKRESAFAQPPEKRDSPLEQGAALETWARDEEDPVDQDSRDWPTYRHDARRSGCAAAPISPKLRVKWKRSFEAALTSPVIAEGNVYFAASDRNTLRALAAETGEERWSYTVGGSIDTPPTIYRGMALFGSADGWVYCLSASDGKLLWRRRAALGREQFVERGRLASPWPVHGNVLVYDGVAYYACGRSSFLDGGITVDAVQPETGKLIVSKHLYTPDPESGNMPSDKHRYDMPAEALGALPDILVGDAGAVYMRHLKFDPQSLEYESAVVDLSEKIGGAMHQTVGAHLMSVAGLLDDTWFNQTYWSIDGKSQCKMLVFSDRAVFGVKPYPGNRRHSRAIFRAGEEGYPIFGRRRPSHQSLWGKKIPLRVRAMVLAGETLLLAGLPDVVPQEDPYAAFEGRAGGRLVALSTENGEKLADYPLEHRPTYDGMAVARGKLFVTSPDGEILCFEASSE